MMRVLFGGLLISIFFVSFSFYSGDSVFAIIPQNLELKQWAFISITLFSFLLLFLMHFNNLGKKDIHLFFFVYPFLNQTTNYFNLSAPFFVLTPAFLFLLCSLFLSKNIKLSTNMFLVLLFCFSTLVSVLMAENKYTAFAFFVLAVGGFFLIIYLIYSKVVTSSSPVKYIHGLIFSIIFGSLFYLLVEIIVFKIGFRDIIFIFLRQWDKLPMQRYFTGGYREPAGLGFVFSLLFWIVVFFMRGRFSGQKNKWVDYFAMGVVIVFVFIAGTRTALINLVMVFVVYWVLNLLLRQRQFFKIRLIHIVLVMIILMVSGYFLLPRTILTDRSSEQPYWIEPTYISIANHSYRLVGTTASYYKQTVNSWQTFLTQPFGSGPLNPTQPDEKTTTVGSFGTAYYYSLISNLVVIGATFGWISMIIWLILVAKLFFCIVKIKKYEDKQIVSLAVLLFSIILASVLPGTSFVGPMLNWTGFSLYGPITPQLPAVPAEYPALISGVFLGALFGLIEYVRCHIHKSIPLVIMN